MQALANKCSRSGDASTRQFDIDADVALSLWLNGFRYPSRPDVNFKGYGSSTTTVYPLPLCPSEPSTSGKSIDSIADAGNGSVSRDIITDFVAGADKIGLSAIDANSALVGNQTFAFIGTGAFTNVAGQLRVNAAPSFATTIVEGDVDGDGQADFQIMLHGNLILAATDFFL